MEHQDWLCNIINQHISFTFLMILRTFLTPLHPNWQLNSMTNQMIKSKEN